MGKNDEKESLSIKISSVLQKCCPAFERVAQGAAEWHHCLCQAARGRPCVCVWHCTDTCIAGTWPQLRFVKDAIEKSEKESKKFLDLAQKAINKEIIGNRL